LSLKSRSPQAYPAAFILLIISLVSFLGLDYLQSIGDKKNSVLFSHLLKEKGHIYSWVEQELLPFLQQPGWSSLKIISMAERVPETEKTFKKLAIEISEADYELLTTKLKDKLIERGLEYEVKVLKEEERARTVDWILRDKGRTEAFLTFNIIKTPPALPALPPEMPAPSIFLKKKPQEKMISLIIDDLGDNLEALQAIINLSRPLDVSILPFSLYARETAKMAQEHGLEVMLHLPLESINSENNDGGHLVEINSRMSPDEILTTLGECLEILPEVKGVNNHMGSLITQKKEIMEIILAEIKSRGLFFIDSRTTQKSIAYRLAREMGLPCGQRDIFLDAEVNRKSILSQIEKLIHLCQQRGRAIAIGHPYPETLSLLSEALTRIERAGIKIVPVSRIIRPD